MVYACYSKLGRTLIRSRTSQVNANSTLSTRLGRNCPRFDFGPNPGFPRRQWFGRWVDLSSHHLRWKFYTHLPRNHCNSVQISFDANTTFCKFSLFCHMRSKILKFARYPAYSNASSTSQLEKCITDEPHLHTRQQIRNVFFKFSMPVLWQIMN